MLACFGMDDSKVLILDMRSPGQPVAELLGHQAPLSAIAWGSGGDMLGATGGGWIASCGKPTSTLLHRSELWKSASDVCVPGDDCQLLLYDLTSPLPESRPSSTRPPTRPSASRTSNPTTYALSPPTTPSNSRSSPTPSQAVDMLPSRAWTAEGEINNLAFSEGGGWLGCVSGQRLTVLKM
jgi:WD repeat-containing protein 68